MKPTFARKPSDAFLASGAARKRFPRPVQSLTLAALIFGLTGCGGGGTDFTGGGIPIGEAALTGRVVRSEDAALPLYNAQITITATPKNSDAKILHTTTDHNGVFSVTHIPTDLVNGPVTVTAASADGMFKTQQVSFFLTNKHSASVIFALPPAAYTFALGTTLTITPEHLTATPGQTVQFTAQLSDPRGVPLPLTPTLFFDDSFGVLNPDGTFIGGSMGTGDIVAYWYNNLKASASVSIHSAQAANPPDPP